MNKIVMKPILRLLGGSIRRDYIKLDSLYYQRDILTLKTTRCK